MSQQSSLVNTWQVLEERVTGISSWRHLVLGPFLVFSLLPFCHKVNSSLLPQCSVQEPEAKLLQMTLTVSKNRTSSCFCQVFSPRNNSAWCDVFAWLVHMTTVQGREEKGEERGEGPRLHQQSRIAYLSTFHNYKQIPKITNNSHFGGFSPQLDSTSEVHSETAQPGKAVWPPHYSFAMKRFKGPSTPSKNIPPMI